jgi:hypothetical protein
VKESEVLALSKGLGLRWVKGPGLGRIEREGLKVERDGENGKALGRSYRHLSGSQVTCSVSLLCVALGMVQCLGLPCC